MQEVLKTFEDHQSNVLFGVPVVDNFSKTDYNHYSLIPDQPLGVTEDRTFLPQIRRNNSQSVYSLAEPSYCTLAEVSWTAISKEYLINPTLLTQTVNAVTSIDLTVNGWEEVYQGYNNDREKIPGISFRNPIVEADVVLHKVTRGAPTGIAVYQSGDHHITKLVSPLIIAFHRTQADTYLPIFVKSHHKLGPLPYKPAVFVLRETYLREDHVAVLDQIRKNAIINNSVRFT